MCHEVMFACFVHFVWLPCLTTPKLFDLELCFSKSFRGPVFWTLGLNAWGFLDLILFLADLILSTFSGVFLQPIQLHVSSQYLPWVKHSQYILRHFDLEHLQVRFSTVVVFYFITVSWVSYSIVDCLFKVFFPSPLVFLLVDEGEAPLTDLWRIES